MKISFLHARNHDLLRLLDVNQQAGIWTLNTGTKDVWLSDEFLALLGLDNMPANLPLHSLLAEMVHGEDYKKIKELLKNCQANATGLHTQEIRLLHVNRSYKWFSISARIVPACEHTTTIIAGSIAAIAKQQTAVYKNKLPPHATNAAFATAALKSKTSQKSENVLYKETNASSAPRNFFFDEIFKMAKVGGWEVDLVNNTVIWSEQTKRIHEVYNDYTPTVDKTISFFYGASKEIIIDKYKRLVGQGEPYDVEVEFITARKRKIWVRVIGKPVFNSEGKVVAVRGLFQDIDEQKKREIAMETSLAVINKQADKLKDFAHIVSHNLRSHTGNLKMITNMIELETEPEMKLEWLEHIKGLSESLDKTVNNLREIVNSHIGMQEDKKQIFFSEVYNNVIKALTLKISSQNVMLAADFSQCESVEYVPAYLESIILNLVSNAIKYRHPQKHPVVIVTTFFEDNHPCLSVCDNGMGIDLVKYGQRLFKMNETFHNNADARGIGLYITKNQVEKMGGSITVNSEVNKGTTFKIKF